MEIKNKKKKTVIDRCNTNNFIASGGTLVCGEAISVGCTEALNRHSSLGTFNERICVCVRSDGILGSVWK